ncbi:hypothetical protein [Burkholderia sp. Ax-1724]|uniref:hypothetical protein n=1 Tax=Burkholderia sp. Ax-1724 TaxID=2608336 RepID=UPI00142272E7|nr:hypothetical protein [Burkholderia sp. Ax-1724]NIF51419.1 hypothetical protein [Burkholderia sp. Ax-1724]
MGFGKPSMPSAAAPLPPPPAPTAQSAQGADAAKSAQQRAAMAGGPSSTIITGAAGLTNPASTTKTTLGS